MTRIFLSALMLLGSISLGHAQVLLAQTVGKWQHTSQSGNTTVWLEIAPQGAYSLVSKMPFGSGQTIVGTVQPSDGILLLQPAGGDRPSRLTNVSGSALTLIIPLRSGDYTATFNRQ